MAASSQVREVILEEGAHPVGPVGRRFTLLGHRPAELLGKEGLGPGGDAGDTQATIQSWTVQLLPSKALKCRIYLLIVVCVVADSSQFSF